MEGGDAHEASVAMRRIGVFFGTFQPMHLGHLGDIQRHLENVDHLIILISDLVEKGGRMVPAFMREQANPFTYQERREMVEKTLLDKADVDSDRFSIAPFSEYLRGLGGGKNDSDLYLVARNGGFVKTLEFALRNSGRFTGTFGPQHPAVPVPESELRTMIRNGRHWDIFVPKPAAAVVHRHLKAHA